MNITLTQTIAAAHPDRPRAGMSPITGAGLRINATGGINGAELPLTLAAPVPGWHVRLALRVVNLAGRLTVARLLDDQHDQPHVGPTAVLAELHVDAGKQALEATFPGGPTLSAPLHAELGWRLVELGYDPEAQQATWSIDGVVRDSVQPIALPALAALTLGGVRRTPGTTGTVDLDELKIDAQPIGPIPVAPASAFADDPARWLVLYNRNDPQSRQWMAQYGETRTIPFGHRLGLDLPTDETTDETTFRALAGAVHAYLTRWDWSERIVGILCGHGVPGTFIGDSGVTHSVADVLRRRDLAALTDGATLYAVAHALADAEALPDRAALLDTDLPRLAARIDGADAADSMTWTDRALALESDPLTESATLWVDTETDVDTLLNRRDALAAWNHSLRREAARMQTITTTDTPDGHFPQVDQDAFVFTFDPADPPGDFFTDAGARRVFALHHEVSAPAWQTLRGADTGWVAASRAAGYAATAGVVRATSADALPWVGTLIDALRSGWTLAEAWAVASPWVGLGMTLLGDPLLTVAFPRRGWDGFGPFDVPPVGMALGEAIAHLRFAQREWTVPDALRPTEGETAWFALCAVNAQGMVAPGWHVIGVQTSHGEPVRTLPASGWPNRPGWRPRRMGDAWRIEALWPQRFVASGITHIIVQRERPGEAVVQVATHAVDPRRHTTTFDVPVASDATERFRLRAEGANGAFVHSPWSAWLTANEPQPGEVVLV